MPVVNIRQGRESIAGARALRANTTAVEAQARESNSRATLNEQDANYFDQTGTSRAQADAEQTKLKQQELLLNITKFNHEINRTGTEDDLRTWDIAKEVAATVNAYIDKGGDPTKAQEFWKNQLTAAHIYGDMKEAGLGDFNPDLIKALAHTAKSVDPYDTANYVTSDGKTIPADKNNPEQMRGIEKNNPGGFWASGLGNAFTADGFRDFLTKDKTSIRDLKTEERNFQDVSSMIDQLKGMDIRDWQRGLSGNILRSTDNIVSAVTQLAQDAVSSGVGTGVVDANGKTIQEATWIQQKFNSFAGPSAAHDKLAFALSYANARMDEGSSGRALSAKDIDIQARNITGSKAQQDAALDVMKKGLTNRMKFRYEQAGIEVPDYMKKYLDSDNGRSSTGKSFSPDETELLNRVRQGDPNLTVEELDQAEKLMSK